jgi:hypothetical protein
MAPFGIVDGPIWDCGWPHLGLWMGPRPLTGGAHCVACCRFLPTWARLGPWQLVFWTSYEHLRSLGALPSF